MDKRTALLVIDLQNDYLENGRFPLWNAEQCKQNILGAIRAAGNAGMPVILVQHIAESGMAPFFNAGTPGAELASEVRAAAPAAPVVVKHFADSFYHTGLEALLRELGVQKLLICGMMTQNCVTFTALSKAAEPYAPTVLTDCCTTVSEMVHRIALNALAIRVELAASDIIGRS